VTGNLQQIQRRLYANFAHHTITDGKPRPRSLRSAYGARPLFAFHSNYGSYCVVSEIQRDIGRKLRTFYTPPVFIVAIGGDPDEILKRFVASGKLE